MPFSSVRKLRYDLHTLKFILFCVQFQQMVVCGHVNSTITKMQNVPSPLKFPRVPLWKHCLYPPSQPLATTVFCPSHFDFSKNTSDIESYVMWGFEFDKPDIFVNAPFLNTIFFFLFGNKNVFALIFKNRFPKLHFWSVLLIYCEALVDVLGSRVYR